MNPRGVASVFVPVFGSITRAPRSSVSELPSLQDASPLHPGRRPLLGVADQIRIVETQKGEESFQGMSEPMLVTTLRQGTVFTRKTDQGPGTSWAMKHSSTSGHIQWMYGPWATQQLPPPPHP